MSSTKFSAVTSILLGVAAIILPYLFGTFAVMMLGGVMLASGIVALLYVNAARKEGIPVSVFAPWVQVIAGVVILIWPGLALWIVAVILGGGLILSGITGLTALRDSGVVNPPVIRKIELWSSIAAYSTPSLPLIPEQACHPFQTKAATDSRAKLPPWQIV